MYPDPKYREYLLGHVDAETEAGVDEAILDGRVDPEHLHQIEEELIDDLLFNRLSAEEEHIIKSGFLSTPSRIDKLKFSHALQRYAAQYTPEPTLLTAFSKLRRWIAIPWTLPLAGALACCSLATFWLAERNLTLSQELTVASQANDEQRRIIASMREEQQRGARQPAMSVEPSVPIPAKVATEEENPTIELSPGENRGLATVPVLHLTKQASIAFIVLELSFKPKDILHIELLNYDKTQQIWNEQFTQSASLSTNGHITIALPARLLITGQYYLRTSGPDPSENDVDSKPTYQFRVRRD